MRDSSTKDGVRPGRHCAHGLLTGSVRWFRFVLGFGLLATAMLWVLKTNTAQDRPYAGSANPTVQRQAEYPQNANRPVAPPYRANDGLQFSRDPYQVPPPSGQALQNSRPPNNSYDNQAYGQQPEQPPRYPAPGYGQPPNGQPPFGQRPFGQPAYGQPPQDQAGFGPPPNGQAGFAQPPIGQPGFGNPNEAFGPPQDWIANHPQPEPSPPPQLFEQGRILARVGDHTIFAGDLLPEINELIELHMADAPESIKATQREKLIKQMLPKAVEQKLMYVDSINNLPKGADLEDIKSSLHEQFSAAELPNMLEKFEVKSARELDARLRTYGGSVRRFRDRWAENQVIAFSVRQRLDIDPEVTHQEMLEYYREHLDDYAIEAKARWQELVVKFDKFPSKDAALREIADMGNEVVYGAPMDAVARRRSQGFQAAEGGYHDWTTQGALRAKELDQALFELPIDYLSDIIETDNGFHIIRVVERQQADFVSFRDAQLKIRETLKAKKQNELLQEYMTGLRRDIPVWTILTEEESEQR